MKKCKYCKSEIDSKAKVCPNCRKPQGSPILRIIIGVIVGLILLVLIVQSLGSDDSSDNGIFTKDNFSYEVTSSKPDSANVGYYIEGIVTNNTSKSYSYVQIEFVCYDKEGINLGTAVDNVNNLGGNEKWKFKAMGLFDNVKNVDHCDFKEVTGF